jgi:hypothetical protein
MTASVFQLGRWVPRQLAPLAFAVLAACGADDDPPRTDIGVDGTGATGSAAGGTAGVGGTVAASGGAGGEPGAPTGYPEGPYSGDVGGIIFNYQFDGFVNESAVGDPLEQPFGPYSMAAMRESGKSYAFLVLAETWCTGCITTAGQLGERADELAALDAVVVEVLLSGDRSALEAWIATYDLAVTSVVAVTPTLGQDLGGRERGVIVDLSTMEIVYNRLGAFGTDTTLLEDALAKLAELGATGS